MTTREDRKQDPRYDRFGLLPLDEFRCQHWGHEKGIINDQQCDRLRRDGDTLCAAHRSGKTRSQKSRGFDASNPFAGSTLTDEERAAMLADLMGDK
jgi:hypothetical protein